MTRRTALIVPVAEAEDAVGALRLRLDPSAALGVPAHVTILVPFAPLDEVDEDALIDLLKAHRAFDFTLDRVEWFDDGVVYLSPEPAGPFAELTHAVAARWPDYPPYEGAFDEVVPHLTVAWSDDREALDAFAQTRDVGQPKRLRQRIEHARLEHRRRSAQHVGAAGRPVVHVFNPAHEAILLRLRPRQNRLTPRLRERLASASSGGLADGHFGARVER